MIVNESDLFPLKNMDYAGIEVKVPNNYDKILRIQYGDYMNTPNKLWSHLNESEIKQFAEEYRNHTLKQ